jgi:hypothetical protein
MNTTTKKTIVIGNITATSAAQVMTAIAYGDSNSLPFRCLDFQCSCDSFEDFKKCLKIINQYNEFDADEIIASCSKYLNLRRFYRDGNPNNGNDMYSFKIAREGSVAFYVECYLYPSGNHVLGLSEVPIPFTKEDFMHGMKAVEKASLADEFSIEDNGHSLSARFWLD